MKLLDALALSNKIRRPAWFPERYLYYNKPMSDLVIEITGPTSSKAWQSSVSELTADDWVCFREAHDFTWAVYQLNVGASVCRMHWKGDYVKHVYDEQLLCLFRPPSARGIAFTQVAFQPTLADLSSKDWTSYDSRFNHDL